MRSSDCNRIQRSAFLEEHKSGQRAAHSWIFFSESCPGDCLHTSEDFVVSMVHESTEGLWSRARSQCFLSGQSIYLSSLKQLEVWCWEVLPKFGRSLNNQPRLYILILNIQCLNARINVIVIIMIPPYNKRINIFDTYLDLNNRKTVTRHVRVSRSKRARFDTF